MCLISGTVYGNAWKGRKVLCCNGGYNFLRHHSYPGPSMQGKTARIWRALGGERDITPAKRADSMNEKWPENLAFCHKPIHLNACAVHDSFSLKQRYKSYINTAKCCYFSVDIRRYIQLWIWGEDGWWIN